MVPAAVMKKMEEKEKMTPEEKEIMQKVCRSFYLPIVLIVPIFN